MTDTVTVRRLETLTEAHIAELAGVLIDCVEGGASIGFMLPVSQQRAMTFWRGLTDDVATGRRAVFVALDGFGIVGTVQLVLEQPDNQPHRADLAKMQVHRRGRRRGIGKALIHAAETCAWQNGKSLLVLDTISDSDAAHLYTRLGWTLAGQIPNYALMPEGGLAPTSIYYRNLAS